jgi:hypothetical protein
MALTIVAVVNTATATATLNVSGGSPDYTVEAAPAGGRQPYTVRTTWSLVTGDPSGRIGVDGELPLNTPTQYVVTDQSGAQAQSDVVTVTSDVPLLSDALDPGRVLPVVVASQKPNRWQARSVWFDVLGQREPFASIAPLRLRGGTLTLLAQTRTDRGALLNLFANGHPLVLRSSCPDAVDDGVLLPESITEDLTNPERPDGPTLITVQYQAVSRDLGPVTVDPGRTYADLPLEAATYAQLLSLYATYDALRVGDPGAGLGDEQISNGSFSSGGAGWDSFWSGAGLTLSYAAGTALWTAPPDNSNRAGVLTNLSRNRPVPAGVTALRVTGRVRSTSPATTCRVQLLSNDGVTGQADYFQAGVALSDAPMAAGPAWQSFAVEVPLPGPGDTIWTMYLRADSLRQDAQVEWDDVSARWRTP